MVNSIQQEIIEVEVQLRNAMMSSDLPSLERLLADNLVFTTHLGFVMSKQDDLNAHRSGQIKIKTVLSSEQQIQTFDSFVIVTVKNNIAGSFGGTFSENDFRFTRVWSRSVDNTWQVVAGHASIIN